MNALNRKITISREAYKNARYEDVMPSVEDAFNDMLSRFSDSKRDERYSDDLHQILTNDMGEKYYFDSFKYIYSILDTGNISALNNNVGSGKMCKVSTHGEQMVISKYDFRGETAEFELVRMTEQSREFMRQYPASSDGKISEFVFQVTGGFGPCVETLETINKVTAKKEIINNQENIVCRDEEGNMLATTPYMRGSSFYEVLTKSLDIVGMLSKQSEKARQR